MHYNVSVMELKASQWATDVGLSSPPSNTSTPARHSAMEISELCSRDRQSCEECLFQDWRCGLMSGGNVACGRQ